MSTNEALHYGMDAIEGRGNITVERAVAKPKARPKSKDEAQADADAWNMLRHLSKLI